MEGHEIRFNVYANSQEEADAASKAIKDFVTEMAKKGIAVSANHTQPAVSRWRGNVFVTNYFK